MTADDALLDRARSGDADAFTELTEPHRRELHVHCYRMLGSFDDADDAVQETLLAAWRGLATFQARASVRTWLYRVATNTCLNLVRTATRRPQMTDPLPATAPAPTGSEKVTWLQPYPDLLLDALPDDAPGPDVRVEQNEAVSLAFVTALQLLSPRARAVLILRDVLGFSAREVADTLDSTEEAVAMTLSRARASLRGQPLRSPARASTAAEAALVRRLAAALTANNVDEVVSLPLRTCGSRCRRFLRSGRAGAAPPSSWPRWRSGWSPRPGSSRPVRTGSPPSPSIPATRRTDYGTAAGSWSLPCAATRWQA